MISDLKIEIFAYNLFTTWSACKEKENKPNILKSFGDECKEVANYEEACDELFLIVLSSRQVLFNKIYEEEFTDEKAERLESILDCYEYVISTCDRYDLFGHLTVFQRMFATLSFVLLICLRMHLKTAHLKDVVKYGHILWTIYFDKYTKEFYENGGWSELKKEAKSYKHLPEFALHFYKDTLWNLQATKEACVNFFHFKNGVDYQKHPINISYLWIKFRIKHFKDYIKIPLDYELSIDAYKAELLLEDLKSLLNPSVCNPDIKISKDKIQGRTFSPEMSDSEIHCGTEEMNANIDDFTENQRLTIEHESRVIDKAPDDFSRNSTEQSQNRRTTSNKNELSFDIQSNRNGKLAENTFIETDQLRQTNCKDATEISNLEHKLLPALDMKMIPETSIENFPNFSNFDLNRNCSSKSSINKKEDCFYEGNAEEKHGVANENQVTYIHQMEETQYHKQTCPTDHTYTTLAKGSVNNFNEKRNAEEKLKYNVYSNTEKQSKIANAVDAISTKHIGGPDFNELSLGPFRKDFKSVNENVNIDEEKEMIRKARKDIRNEQKNPEVKNFLKMLMILGDNEEAKFLFSTLQGEETTRNSKENSKKKIEEKA